MDIKDLKVGDLVYIREDLEFYKMHGSTNFNKSMKQGVQRIMSIDGAEKSFNIASEAGSFRWRYTLEMIDWDKTIHLRCMENLAGVHSEEDEQDSVHNPSHYGGGGKHDIECYKAMEYILDKLENVPEKYYGHVSNIVKYIWRCNSKNGYEDLDKASVYFDFMFREEE